MNIIKPSCAMRAKPSETSELETEILFGETIEILDRNQEWIYCRLLTDSYCGWVKENNLGPFTPLTHRVIANRSFLFEDKSSKSIHVDYLPLGSQLSIKNIKDSWATISLDHGKSCRFAYIPSNHIVKIDNKSNNWVSTAERLIGTPYKWGGRDSIGLDCSALLQLSYQTYGQNISRNTIDQIKLRKKIITDTNNLGRGFVVFWKGHVGIMVDNVNCVHANGFHMQTTREPLENIVTRMGKNNPILKIMDFN